MLAILVALSLGGCSDVWSKFTSARASSDIEKDAAMNADDDTKCQSAGFQYGTPEYSQCRESIVSKRTLQGTSRWARPPRRCGDDPIRLDPDRTSRVFHRQ
jgi:hypothetical protein